MNSETKSNGPAFSQIESTFDFADINREKIYTAISNYGGLTTREYFAAKAMRGILADQKFVQPNQASEIARLAVLNADALIWALNKPPI